MSHIQDDNRIEKWVEVAFENFEQAVYEGNYALAKDIIADTQEVDLAAGREMNLKLRGMAIGQFQIKSHVQPQDL